MKTNPSLWCLLLLLCHLSSAMHAAQPENGSCASATKTAEMLSCQNLRLQQAQKKLDQVLATALARRDTTGKLKLRIAQAAWLQFRKANSDFAADDARGGTLAPLIATTVRADMTESRSAELQKYVDKK